MSSNPYQSPNVGPTGPAGVWAGPPLVYRGAGGLVFWTTLAIAAVMISNTGLTVCTALAETVFADLLKKEDFEPSELPTVLAIGGATLIGAVAILATLVASAILFCMTVYRFNKNVRALGSGGLEHTPGWSVGWFFIPIAHLFKPYQAVCEIYKASDPKAGQFDWRQSPILDPLGWWWGTWIVSNILSNIEARLSWQEVPLPAEASLALSAVSLVLSLAAGVLAIRVVRAIHARQEAKAAVVRAKPTAMPQGYGEEFR